MGRNDFISGSVLEFKLPANLGIAYCKVLDFRYIREFDGVLAKVFDHVVKEPIDNVAELSEKDWMFGARRMPFLPGTRGKGAWVFRGVLISEEDHVIPEFRYSTAISEKVGINHPWHIVRNINQYSEETYPFESVKHLENTIVSTRLGISIRAGMEYLRSKDIDVFSYFDLKDEVNTLIYRQMMSVTRYKDIPHSMRGKAIAR